MAAESKRHRITQYYMTKRRASLASRCSRVPGQVAREWV